MTYQEGLLGLLWMLACAGVATLFVTLGGWVWKKAVRLWWWISVEGMRASVLWWNWRGRIERRRVERA